MQQASLFDLLPPENPAEMAGVAGIMPQVCAEMSAVAEEYEPGRKQLAADVTAVAERERVGLTAGGGKELKVEVLDKWLQPSQKGHVPTLEAILCYCLATRSARPVKPILKLLGLTVIPLSDLDDLEYGKLCREQESIKERKRLLNARRKGHR